MYNYIFAVQSQMDALFSRRPAFCWKWTQLSVILLLLLQQFYKNSMVLFCKHEVGTPLYSTRNQEHRASRRGSCFDTPSQLNNIENIIYHINSYKLLLNIKTQLSSIWAKGCILMTVCVFYLT